MRLRVCPLVVLPLALALGCPPWPEFTLCEEVNGCETTQAAATTGDVLPTTGEGVQTVTGGGDGADASSGGAAPEAQTGTGTGTTGEQAAEQPLILSREIAPDYTAENALLAVTVTAEHAEGVRLMRDDGALSELTPLGFGEFIGQLPAFTALDNGKRKAVLTPWRAQIEGASVEVDYVIALPPPGYEVAWQTGPPDVSGKIAAIAVLPDGRPVEFGIHYEKGGPRCYLRLRDKLGAALGFFPVLPGAHCRAIDLAIDDQGVMHVLLERKSGEGLVWWAGEIGAWGSGAKQIGLGQVGDTALALAARPGVVAVCGARSVPTADERDGLVVLLRPNEPAQARLFDYRPSKNLEDKHRYGETVRDCDFSGNTLVLVGEAHGQHDGEPEKLDRLMMIEYDLAADDAAWLVAGPGPGTQSRALAVDVDDKGRYHLAGYTCADDCAPDGEYRIYAPGGKLVWQASLGPLGSELFGPHAIAWSPAGYVVLALGAMQGQSHVFKVQARVEGNYKPLWTFIPNDKQGFQIALAVAIGLLGEVYAGGIGADAYPAFAVIAS